MFKVYLADDHAILREGLKFLLQGDPELSVTGESGTGKDTVREVIKGKFDLLVLDVHFPDIDGLDILLQIKKRKPRLAVLVLTLNNDKTLALRFLQAGAAGYVAKDMPPWQIVEAMRQVAHGGIFFDLEMMTTAVSSVQHINPHMRLTNREYTIFLKLVAGLSIQAIAKELNVASSTVGNHRTHIMAKMHLTSNAEMVRYAMEWNLYPDSRAKA